MPQQRLLLPPLLASLLLPRPAAGKVLPVCMHEGMGLACLHMRMCVCVM